MEGKFNMKNYLDSTKVNNLEIDKNLIYRAALSFNYDIDKDFGHLKPEEVKYLKDNSSNESKNKYFLNSNLFNTSLEAIVKQSLATELIDKFNLSEDKLSKLLLKLCSNDKIDLSALSEEDLFIYNKLISYFPQRGNQEEVKVEITKRQFLNKFYTRAEGFVGRKKELEQLKEYVDWLPKTGIFQIFKSGIRNLINWHDKAPLIIRGVGGIGKSALISKFICENYRIIDGKKLPFIYIDFDLPGFSISEFNNIIIEGIRQLSIQFPTIRSVLEEFKNNIIKLNHGIRQENSSRINYIFYELLDNNETVALLNSIEVPILIVFDSFEEMQYRCDKYEIIDFFRFIEKISEFIPRIRFVFAGRSEVEIPKTNAAFQNIELNEFDKVTSFSLMLKSGISDKDLMELTYSEFGGNPLLLRLIAKLYESDNSFIFSPYKMKEIGIQQFLVTRIMEHVHNEKARRVAIPGLILRKISPEIILNILAEPCKLTLPKEDPIIECNEIFESLKKEAFLIIGNEPDGEFYFRADLRKACGGFVKEKFPIECELIHRNAISYYKNSTEVKDFAEYFYHLLKLGIEPIGLTKDIYYKIVPYIETELNMLPEISLINISKITGLSLKNTNNDLSKVEIQEYYYKRIISALNSNIFDLKSLDKEIKFKNDNLYSYNFLRAFALLKQRLNKIEQSNEIIQFGIQQNGYLGDNNIETIAEQRNNLYFMMSENYEYLNDFKSAYNIFEKLIDNDEKMVGIEKKYANEGLFRFKVEFQKRKLFERNLDNKFSNVNSENNNNYNIFDTSKYVRSNVYYSDYVGRNTMDIKWLYLYINITSFNIKFMISDQFTKTKRSLINSVKDLNSLERLFYKNIGKSINEITFNAELPILIHDYLIVKEILKFNINLII